MTKYEEARRIAAARALATGEVKIQLECEHCRSTSVYQEEEGHPLTCITCGKSTGLGSARRDRRLRIKKFIADGIDVTSKKRVLT